MRFEKRQEAMLVGLVCILCWLNYTSSANADQPQAAFGRCARGFALVVLLSLYVIWLFKSRIVATPPLGMQRWVQESAGAA